MVIADVLGVTREVEVSLKVDNIKVATPQSLAVEEIRPKARAVEQRAVMGGEVKERTVPEGEIQL